MSEIERGTVVFYHGSLGHAHGTYCIIGTNSIGRYSMGDHDGNVLRGVRRTSFTPLRLTAGQQLIFMLLADHGLTLDLTGYEDDCRILEANGYLGSTFVDHRGGITRYYLTATGAMVANAIEGL